MNYYSFWLLKELHDVTTLQVMRFVFPGKYHVQFIAGQRVSTAAHLEGCLERDHHVLLSAFLLTCFIPSLYTLNGMDKCFCFPVRNSPPRWSPPLLCVRLCVVMKRRSLLNFSYSSRCSWCFGKYTQPKVLMYYQDTCQMTLHKSSISISKEVSRWPNSCP